MQYGVLPAKVDLRDYKICSANIQVEYPKTFELLNLPKVKNLGEVNSCCAHATSSILEYYDGNNNVLSTNFIYGTQKKLYNQCLLGMYLALALQTVLKFGDCRESACPGNTEVPGAYKVAEEALENEHKMNDAFKYHIESYYLCLTENDIKFALMNYGPVLGAIMWHDSYIVNKSGVVFFNKNSAGGGHAVMVYGWNETGWLIQNSWGTKFANKGRFILPYEYGLMEARAVIDYDNSNDIACCRPKRNKVLDIYYKIANKILNIIKKVKRK